jgi:hypothetical protein
MAEGKNVKLDVLMTDRQYQLLLDCLQTAETHYRYHATAIASENTEYANRIRYLQDLVRNMSHEVGDSV